VLALGYVTARLVESGFIAVGILSLVTVVTLRQQSVGADAASLVAGPLLCAAGTAALLGVLEQGAAAQTIAAMPEFVLGIDARHLSDRERIPAIRGRCPTCQESDERAPGRGVSVRTSCIRVIRWRSPM